MATKRAVPAVAPPKRDESPRPPWFNPGNPKQHDWELMRPGWKCKRAGCGTETMFINELREAECRKS